MKDGFRGETEEFIKHDLQHAQHQKYQYNPISTITLKKFFVVYDANYSDLGYKVKRVRENCMNFTLPAVALGAFISICLHFLLAPIIG